MGDLPAPSFTTTYRRADGGEIGGEYGWVIHAEFFEDIDEPVDVIVETWERTKAEVVTFKPSWWVEDPCENCGESIAAHTDDEGAECWDEAVNGSEVRRRTRASGQPTEQGGDTAALNVGEAFDLWSEAASKVNYVKLPVPDDDEHVDPSESSPRKGEG